MDPGAATVLAAGISAAVVAGTFLAGEVIRLIRDRSERRAAAIGNLLAALSEIPDLALEMSLDRRPFSLLRARRQGPRAVMDVAVTSTALYGALPRRDFAIADWVGWQVATLPMHPEPMTKRAAEISGIVLLYMSDRRNAINFVRRENPKFERWKSEARSTA